MLEFQKRGAPHFHIFIQKPLDRHTVSRAWNRIVGSNDPKHLAAGTTVERFRYPPALGSYVMKYAAKIEQKEVPASYERVGRFWGTWGMPKLVQTIRLPVDIGKHYVRYIRRAFIKQRRTWVWRSRFKDNGRAGFIAWDSAKMVRRITDDLLLNGVLHPT